MKNSLHFMLWLLSFLWHYLLRVKVERLMLN